MGKLSQLAAVFWLLAGASASMSNGVNCCAALSRLDGLGGKIAYPNTTLYEERLESYYSANAALTPSCMLLPESTQDVSQFMHMVSSHHCPFGIRSGGHSAYKGANSVDDGITLDFSYMNETTYDIKTTIASVQPGARWGAVYNALDPFGVTAVGGRADVVGVGGFITGGGYSFYAGTMGWACDTVHNFEIVLANGSVIDVNHDEHQDLFQAMKGSSGNLGLVTRVDLNTINSTQIWGGYLTYDWADRAAVFDAYYYFAEDFGKDPASEAIIVMVYAADNLSLWSILSNTQAVIAPPAFNNYTAISNLSDTTTVGSIAELVPEFTGATPLGVYSNWFSGSISNAVVTEFLEFYYQTLTEYIDKMEAVITHNSSLSVVGNMQPIPQTWVDISKEMGGNVLGLDELVLDGPLAAWLFSVTVTEKDDQPAVLELAEEFVSTLEAYSDSLGANKNWHYLNYAYKTQDPIAGYGDEAVAKIKAASAAYDPHGVFQELRHSGFKIPV
ncbi:fad binding domain-containing protein [Diaporthe amygdali]|uniref:fad binding domain-containing protein n=1 Tax=Phomopsis amygdali TaxID=1214568 RepID=UPI0022FF25D2|nr:fad binding domain-containing protein [Diaporthe amygdali]KAJ0123266.1 fad binding domain-containing protein [Diaporthe amygdali]